MKPTRIPQHFALSHKLRSHGKLFSVLCVLTLLSFSMACGNSNSSGNPPTTGKFSNASLKGSYAYNMSGSYFGLQSGNGDFREAGVFTADGNGNITSGTDDFVQGSTPGSFGSNGTYFINNDGTGGITLNVAGGQVNFALTIVNDSQAYLIEFDSFANGAGIAERQDTTALSATPSGTFVFRTHSTSTSQGSISTVGAITISGGAVSGAADTLQASALTSPILTGSFSAPTSDGRGTASLSTNTGTTYSYIYYVVNANTLNLLEADAGPLGIGRAEKQSATSFSNASLKGPFAFGSRGDTSANILGVNSAGSFTSDGNGTITAGSYDSVQDGNVIANAALTGTYSMTSNGRATVTLTPAGQSATSEIFWMVSNSRAFFLVNTPSRVEDGTLDQQQSTSFATSSFNGQYAFFMDGFDSLNPLVDRVGNLLGDGKGNLTLNYSVNSAGSGNSVVLTGTYAVGANGRLAGTVPNLTGAMILYLVSNNQGYMILGDTGAQVSGNAALQTSP
ncbi:MAG TPA: hypothetical protein VFA89_19035 [Terriglobales bacterium]|nr:hypothetical protein [Terriglobales bacterium]